MSDPSITASFASVDPRLLEVLVCPVTRGPLVYDRAKGELVSKAARLTRYGGDCYLFAAMALGFVDVIIEAGFHEWDVAALMPLIEGAGGVITSWDGGTPISGKSILAVGDKALHAQVMALLK